MQDTIWQTAHGELYLVSQMETRHIQNCLNLMDERARLGKPWRERYRERLQLELEIRQLGHR